jgi:hypothetical protein
MFQEQYSSPTHYTEDGMAVYYYQDDKGPLCWHYTYLGEEIMLVWVSEDNCNIDNGCEEAGWYVAFPDDYAWEELCHDEDDAEKYLKAWKQDIDVKAVEERKLELLDGVCCWDTYEIVDMQAEGYINCDAYGYRNEDGDIIEEPELKAEYRANILHWAEAKDIELTEDELEQYTEIMLGRTADALAGMVAA